MSELRDFIETAKYIPSRRATLDKELRDTQITLGKLYAEAEKTRRRIQKTKEKIARIDAKEAKISGPARTHWTDRDIAVAMNPTLTDSEVAKLIGRTPRAVMLKRYKIRQTFRAC